MTTWTWHRTSWDFEESSTNDLGWGEIHDLPLDGGTSLQRVIMRFGCAGWGNTLGPVFGLVPAAWLMDAAIDTLTPRGAERIYFASHPAQLSSEPQFDDTTPDTPWQYQYAVMPFEVDIQVHNKIPAGNVGSLIRFSLGMGAVTPGLQNAQQYAAEWRARGSFQYLTSSEA